MLNFQQLLLILRYELRWQAGSGIRIEASIFDKTGYVRGASSAEFENRAKSETYRSPCPQSTAHPVQYVYLNDLDLIAGVFYGGILLLRKMRLRLKPDFICGVLFFSVCFKQTLNLGGKLPLKAGAGINCRCCCRCF